MRCVQFCAAAVYVWALRSCGVAIDTVPRQQAGCGRRKFSAYKQELYARIQSMLPVADSEDDDVPNFTNLAIDFNHQVTIQRGLQVAPEQQLHPTSAMRLKQHDKIADSIKTQGLTATERRQHRAQVMKRKRFDAAGPGLQGDKNMSAGEEAVAGLFEASQAVGVQGSMQDAGSSASGSSAGFVVMPRKKRGGESVPKDAQGTTAAAAAAAADTAGAASPHDALYPHILHHGRGILSLSTLQQGLQHFLLPDVGYIAYAMMFNGPEFLNIKTPVALGDPICDPANFALIAGAFLKQHPKAMFMQVSAAFALVLRSFGLLINSVGGETQLDLANYTFAGYAKRGLRSAIASAAKGVVVEEVMQAAPMLQAAGKGAAAAAAAAGGADWAQLASEMKAVDRQWISRKGKHAGRVWFINRLPVFAPEPGVRKFTAREAGSGRLLGFIFFDAVFEASNVVGYYANVTRMVPDAHPGVLNLLVSNFMDRVREEGRLAAPAKKLSVKKSLLKKQQQQQQQQVPDTAAAGAAEQGGKATNSSSTTTTTSSSSSGIRFISLGLSPLYQMDDDTFTCSNRIRLLFEFSFKQGSGYYPFAPLAAAKAKYGAGLHDGRYSDPAATYQQVYLAHSHHALACVAMFDLGKLLGFWSAPPDAAAAYLGHKISDGSKALKKVVKKLKQRSSSSSSSSSSSGGGGCKAGKDASSGSGSGKQCCVNKPAGGHGEDGADGVLPAGCMLLNFSRKCSSSSSSSKASPRTGEGHKELKVKLPLACHSTCAKYNEN
ncbi:hypothetical protein OEZ86_005321 [Tetradesmus obliquus]|nr:hypothetical protein OEZ86_005321 [Tetradesmus obliquus]